MTPDPPPYEEFVAGGPRTYEEFVQAGFEMLTYTTFGELLGAKPQSMRRAMMRRREHIAANAAVRGVALAQGRARPTDLPEPDCWTSGRRAPEPKWARPRAVQWAMQAGRLASDGVSPVPSMIGKPRSSAAA